MTRSSRGPLRVVGVGAGQHFRHAHFRALDQNPMTELVGVVDVPGNRVARQWAEANGIRFFDNHVAAYQIVQPDLVIVASTPNAHEVPSVDALRRGIHVKCEKPGAHNLESMRAIAAAARDAKGATFEVGFKHCADDRVKRFLSRSGIGTIHSAHAKWVRSNLAPPGPPGALRWSNGGGALIDLPHPLFRAWWHMGFPPAVSVRAAALAVDGDRLVPWTPASEGVESSIEGVILFEGGQRMSFEISWHKHRSPGEDVECELTGSDGALTDRLVTDQEDTSARRPSVWHWKYGDITPPELLVDPLGEHELYAADLERTIRVIQGDAEPLCGWRRALHLQAIIDAAYRATGGTDAVEVHDTLPLDAE